MGIVDQDTKSTVIQDFQESIYPGSKEKYEIDIMNQIEFILSIIHKKTNSNI